MNISDLFVFKETSIKNALEIIDKGGLACCILVQDDFQFIRTVTDGDIRRLLIEGKKTEDPLSFLTDIQSISAAEGVHVSNLRKLFQEHDIRTIPILDQKNKPVDIVLRKDLEVPILLSYPHLSGGEMDYIQQAFDTNWIAPLGPNVEDFEKELAQYVGCKYALAVSSGTAALHLALDVLDIKKDDIVFCSSFTFVASVNPIVYHGAVPVFIDSEPETWNMSPIALQSALEKYALLGKLPKAVIVVDLYGQSADLNRIKAICDSFDVPIVQDSAESLGASYQGKKCGTFGKVGFYSFNGNKIITTSGGGMLVSDDEDIIKTARFLSTQAKEPAEYYLHHRLGYNYRMSNVLAGIGRGQLQVLDERVKRRREIFENYKKALSHLTAVKWMPEPEGYFSTRWLSCLAIDKDALPDKIDKYYNELHIKGIEVRRLWKPMHTQPLYADADYFSHDKDLSVSDLLFDTGLCLPSSSNMSDAQQNKVIDALRSVLGNKN
jgi:dTDP-4-amino-4,6-dideoxygalactose transaminase